MEATACLRVLDDRFDLRRPEELAGRGYRAVVCLFWLAPSTRSRIEQITGGRCYGLPDLVGGELEWGRGAYRLAQRFLAGGRRYGDLRWRSYLTERLYRELHWLQLAIRLGEFAEARRRRFALSELVLEGDLDRRLLEVLQAVLERYPRVSYRPGPGSARAPAARARARKLREGLREGWLTGDWKAQVELLEALDPTFRHRARWGPILFRRRPPPNGVVFVSSYKNDTLGLRVFVDHMPAPVHWLLLNGSALRGVAGDDRTPRFWLWAFAAGLGGRAEVGDRPARETEPGGGETPEPPGYGAWRRSSATLASWSTVERFLLATLTDCWRSYLAAARPRLVVMANQLSIEGWLAAIARRRGIPVLQVMHGALGGYLYTQTPVHADALVVYGEFWRRQWPGEERSKIVAYNPRGRVRVVPRRRQRSRRLTFFSWPLSATDFYPAGELWGRFSEIFRRLLDRRGVRITYRAHPLENPHDFVRRWRRRFGPLPAGLAVSKVEPLEEILAATRVALMFRSTVMLDCLASGIPVVLPGWIDYVWNRELEGLSGVCLARDFDHLEARLEEWLEAPPPVVPAAVETLVAPAEQGRKAFEARVGELYHLSDP